jgi:hypothetical protein
MAHGGQPIMYSIIYDYKISFVFIGHGDSALRLVAPKHVVGLSFGDAPLIKLCHHIIHDYVTLLWECPS